jgi:protein-tyrosine phosphatase
MQTNYNEIIPYLYVGNRYAIDDAYLFDLIINATPDIPFPYEILQKKYKQEYIRITIRDVPCDSENLYNILETQNILDTIQKYISQNKKVLIHCNMGQQRSCAIIACYLIKYNNMNAHTAIEYCKKKRSPKHKKCYLHSIFD